MDAEDLHEIITNMQHTDQDAYMRTWRILAARFELPGMDNYTQHGNPDTFETIGDEVKAMVWEYAASEHDVPDTERTLTSTFIARALGSISATDLGAAFYSTTCDRYTHAENELI